MTTFNKSLRKVMLLIAIGFLIFWSVAPIAWIFISSISPTVELFSRPPHWIPYNPTLKNYMDLLVTGRGFRGATVIPAVRYFRRGLVNSLIYAVTTTLIMAIFSSITGYVFARYNFPLKNVLFYLFIGVIPIPGWAVLITIYQIFATAGLLNTLHGMILLFITYRLPIDTWLMKSYFESIPRDIEEAAMIDGCSKLEAMFKVVMPIALPGVAAVLIVSFISTWNAFLAPLIFTFTEEAKPLTVVISEFIGQYYVEWDLMSAAAVIAIIPPLFFAFIFQKYLIQGLTKGAVKY
ncbi:MAG: carbohydrate ABC transporter permease [Thermoprotei archaeon]|nr:MAG: carbohydrate ABC transporter permease [Thermoprotei archaeon]RLE95549.1 MAG: carbohydrate ABC transporter permease [Thermoprotei archaeon]HDJ97123.1 carbohydrate ABC transporter permease [Thermofilum sp.]